ARPGLKVEHIYEAEAVLMFYLWQSDKLNKKRASEATGLRATKRGERVLVFDFGGGSANYTYASICRVENSMHVTVQQRLGFALGGDHMDSAIARFILRQISSDIQVRSLRPFDDQSVPAKQLRTDLLWVANHVKLAISKSPQKEQPDEGITLSGASPQFKDLFQRCKTVTPNRVMESEPVIKRMD